MNTNEATGSGPGRIVVGIDGSRGSLTALAWAFAEADIHGADLEAVYVYPYDPTTHLAWTYGLTPHLSPETFETAQSEAEQALDEILTKEISDSAVVEVHRRVVAGGPAERLIEAAENAIMLVVGSRGYGGFRSLLLGSVSSQCVQHAPCPVVVVPEGARHHHAARML